MIDEAALLALTIANKKAIGAEVASTSCASLAFLAKAGLTVDTLAVQTEVALLALLALKPIIAPLAIYVHVIRTELAETVFYEGALDAALVGKSEGTKKRACRRNDDSDHENSEQVIAPSRALEARPPL